MRYDGTGGMIEWGYDENGNEWRLGYDCLNNKGVLKLGSRYW